MGRGASPSGLTKAAEAHKWYERGQSSPARVRHRSVLCSVNASPKTFATIVFFFKGIRSNPTPLLRRKGDATAPLSRFADSPTTSAGRRGAFHLR